VVDDEVRFVVLHVWEETREVEAAEVEEEAAEGEAGDGFE
jgi:hypothetical protein